MSLIKRYWSADTLFGHLSINYNMGAQSTSFPGSFPQVKEKTLGNEAGVQYQRCSYGDGDNQIFLDRVLTKFSKVWGSAWRRIGLPELHYE